MPSPQELYPESKELQKLRILEQRGDTDAAYKLALYHTEGARKDSRLALGYLRKGTDNGHADSRLLSLMILMDGFDSPHYFRIWRLLCASRPQSFSIQHEQQMVFGRGRGRIIGL